MSDESNIVRLAVTNSTVQTRGAAARDLVVQFLREWADAIEAEKEDVERCVLIMHNEDGQDNFRVRTRRCNVNLIEQVGIVQLALVDLCTATEIKD